MTEWRENPGHQPRETRGRRIVVRLSNGETHGADPVTATSPLGWAADSCSWRAGGDYPFNIKSYRVLA